MAGTNLNLRVIGDFQQAGQTYPIDTGVKVIASLVVNHGSSVVLSGAYQTILNFTVPPFGANLFRKLFFYNPDATNTIYLSLLTAGGAVVFPLLAGSVMMFDGNAANNVYIDDDAATSADPNTAITSVQAKAAAGTPTIFFYAGNT